MLSIEDFPPTTQRANLSVGRARDAAKPSLCVIPIETFTRLPDGTEKHLEFATAFCEVADGREYLVTSWHNVTGRDPKTGRPRALNGAVPSFVRAHFIELVQSQAEFSYAPLGTFHIDIPVEQATSFSWIMHQDGQAIDIAGVRIGGEKARLVVPISHAVDAGEPQLEICDELYILGFPRGLRPVGNFPIWKRGSIAPAPSWGAHRERCIWIDTVAREGMSGSPVFARTLSLDLCRRQTGNGKARADTHVVTGLAFVGVYSGRRGGPDALEAQNGKVWRAEAVREMLANPRKLGFDLI